MKRTFKTSRYSTHGSLSLSAGGKDSVFVCSDLRDDGEDDDGGEDDGDDDACYQHGVTHYSLDTGEELCSVKLEDVPTGITTVLYDNWSCIAVAYG